MVLSDTYRLPADAASHNPPGRGLKHRREDDQMSVESVESKRQDLTSSAEKDKSKLNQKSGPSKSTQKQTGKGQGSQNKSKPK